MWAVAGSLASLRCILTNLGGGSSLVQGKGKNDPLSCSKLQAT